MVLFSFGMLGELYGGVIIFIKIPLCIEIPTHFILFTIVINLINIKYVVSN